MTDYTTKPKQCSTCKEYFPRTSEYWHKNKNKKDGYANYCKACHNSRNQKRYEENREDILLKQRLNYDPDKKRRYTETHREEKAEYNRQYRVTKGDELKEQKRAYYAANKDEINERRREERVLKAEVINERIRQWAKANPEKVQEKSQRRRARLKGAKGSHTAAEVRNLFQRQNGLCFHCGTDISTGYHEDHWIPLKKQGTNWISNIRLLCPTCNLSKGAKLPHEWCPERYA